MERSDALNLLKKYVKNDNMIKHCLASEVVMGAVAAKCGEDSAK